MCGIVGVAGALAFKDEATIKRLLMLDFFRGVHSTGFAAVRNDKECHVAKISSHPIDLFQMPAFNKALNAQNSQLFLGHNRHATRGEITTFNAHPFEFDNIIGVHNGTLENRCKKRLEKELDMEFSVDSMALFAAIDKFGLDDTMSLVEEGIDAQAGAWSLVWYDKRDHSLNMLRNKWRPMWYAYENTFKRMFFGSRWEDLRASIDLSESGYDPLFEQKGKDKDGEEYCWRFFTTGTDIHYKWDLRALKEGSKERPKPLAKPVEYHPGFTSIRNIGGGGHSGNVWDRPKEDMGFVVTKKSSTTTSQNSSKKKEKDIQVINLIGDDKNPFAGVLSDNALFDLAKNGCFWCTCALDISKPGHFINARTGTILCPSCAGNRGDDKVNRVYLNERQFAEISANS